jgi:predicted Zn-dependent peptidase
MVSFQKFTLDNGLRIIVNTDKNTNLVTLNLLYNVGARDENPERTGFAHLFEHLMFGGSINIPNYDEPVQRCSGENNAFTTNDITNYYLTLPKINIETGFWLESDRMLALAFSEQSLDIQKKVVIEEFNQRYLNQPYGDVWLLLRPLAYKVHPYQWSTIGKNIDHIKNATIDEVKDFFYSYYAPNNAILSVSGNITADEVYELSKKWFLPIEKRNIKPRNIEPEPEQTERRFLEVHRDVPYNAIYRAYHMHKRDNIKYYAADMLSDILSGGNSSRFYRQLVVENQIFSDIKAYITGNIDAGLFVISGILAEGVSVEKAENAIDLIINDIKNKTITEFEINKCKNQIETFLTLSQTMISEKAFNLAYFELLGDAMLYNYEIEKYSTQTVENLTQTAIEIFDEKNLSSLHYLVNNK